MTKTHVTAALFTVAMIAIGALGWTTRTPSFQIRCQPVWASTSYYKQIPQTVTYRIPDTCLFRDHVRVRGFTRDSQ